MRRTFTTEVHATFDANEADARDDGDPAQPATLVEIRDYLRKAAKVDIDTEDCANPHGFCSLDIAWGNLREIPGISVHLGPSYVHRTDLFAEHEPVWTKLAPRFDNNWGSLQVPMIRATTLLGLLDSLDGAVVGAADFDPEFHARVEEVRQRLRLLPVGTLVLLYA